MKSLEDLKKIRDEYAARLAMREHHNDYHIIVGMGTCGIAAGARKIVNKFADELANRNLYNISLTISGCMGECDLEPMVEIINPQGEKVICVKVKEEDVTKIIEEVIIGGKPVTILTKENL